MHCAMTPGMGIRGERGEMRNKRILAVTLLLALAGCGEKAGSGPGEDGEAVSPEQVADRARGFVKPDPGLYRVKVEIEEFAVPGAPPQVAEMIRQSAMSGQESEYCLTPEEVEKGWEESIRKSQQGDCVYKRFDADGARIDAQLTCTDQGRTVDLTLSGTGGRTSSDMAMTMKMAMGEMGEATIRARSRSQRVGDCPA